MRKKAANEDVRWSGWLDMVDVEVISALLEYPNFHLTAGGKLPERSRAGLFVVEEGCHSVW